MLRRIFALSLVCLLFGCATAPPIPPDYAGSKARIEDSGFSETPNRAHFFYLAEYAGNFTDNIYTDSVGANRGRGFGITPLYFRRNVPADQIVKLKLKARIGYGAPIQEIINSSTVYSVERELNVQLAADKHYIVKGILSAEKQEVWLEEMETGKKLN